MSTKSTMDFAEDFLLRNKAHKRPIDVFDLCRKNKITLVPYSDPDAREMAEIIGITHRMDTTDGLAVRIKDMSLIFWDDSAPIMSQRATVAHELGHHLLSHLNHGKYKCECCNCGACQEQQADSFAFNLLFPTSKKFQNTYNALGGC